MLDIELLKPAGTSPSAAIARPNVQMRWEEKLVRSYTVTLEPGAQAEIPGANGHLVIGIAGTASASSGIAKSDLKNGGDAYYAPKVGFQLRNGGAEKAELVLLELK